MEKFIIALLVCPYVVGLSIYDDDDDDNDENGTTGPGPVAAGGVAEQPPVIHTNSISRSLTPIRSMTLLYPVHCTGFTVHSAVPCTQWPAGHCALCTVHSKLQSPIEANTAHSTSLKYFVTDANA